MLLDVQIIYVISLCAIVRDMNWQSMQIADLWPSRWLTAGGSSLNFPRKLAGNGASANSLPNLGAI
jgi:hypothetical protein